MRRLICCEYHEDSQTIELRYPDYSFTSNFRDSSKITSR